MIIYLRYPKIENELDRESIDIKNKNYFKI